MRLLDRVASRYRDQGYYEGMASGAAVLLSYATDSKAEKVQADLVTKAVQAYQTNGPVFACTLLRMSLLSQATFKFRSLVDKHLYGDETLRILEYPWPNATSGELWARMELDAATAGNCYLWGAEADRIVRLPPAEVTIVSEEVDQGGRTYRNVIGYSWEPQPLAPMGPKRPAQYFSVDEIAHWSPIPDPTANFRGQAWWRAVLTETDADTALTGYKTRYLDHGTPVSVIKYAPKIRPDTIDFIQERLAARYGGVNNAWRPLILDQGADPIMGKGLEELDLRNIQAGGEARICGAAGIDPILIGLKSDSGMSYKDALKKFAELTVRHLWETGCASLQKLVPNMPPRGVQLWFDTSDIPALQAAETERAQVTQVSAAAALTFIQAGFTRESVVAAVTSGDLSQLVPDPNAPTPGVQERETINVADNSGEPVTGPDSGNNANSTAVTRPPRTGTPPGGGQVPTQTQTPATKRPMPASIPTMPTANGRG